MDGPCSLSELDRLKDILEDKRTTGRAEVSHFPFDFGGHDDDDVFWIACYV